MVTVYKTEDNDFMADYREEGKWSLIDSVCSVFSIGILIVSIGYLAFRIFFF